MNSKVTASPGQTLYLRMRLVDEQNKPLTDWTNWPSIEPQTGTTDGDHLLVWNVPRLIPPRLPRGLAYSNGCMRMAALFMLAPSTFVIFELRWSTADQLLASARVALDGVRGEPCSVALCSEEGAGGELAERGTLIFRRAPSCSSLKRVFFIRHGESAWNDAQVRRLLALGPCRMLSHPNRPDSAHQSSPQRPLPTYLPTRLRHAKI